MGMVMARPTGPCTKCGAFKGVRFLEHHVTYEPEVTVVLCEGCHTRITQLNTKVARLRNYTPLSTLERYFVFDWWMDEKVVLRRMIDKVVQRLIKDMELRRFD
jgi:hypothetical protein